MTLQFNLTLDGTTNKLYATYEEAKAVYLRVLRAKRNQQKFYGQSVQVLDYISIDSVIMVEGELCPIEFIDYFCGRKLI